MFLNKQPRKAQEYYKRMLGHMGGMSRLFSAGEQPYLAYRAAENLFCRAFEAKNLSRSDASVDASKDGLGIGIKTFLYKNGSSMEKIAEFNSDHDLFKSLGTSAMVKKVAELRNTRLEVTRKMYGLTGMIYHCVVRKNGGIIVYETPMDPVKVGKIKITKPDGNVIYFNDGINEYSFNKSKSTLYRKFSAKKPSLDFSVSILEDPFGALVKLFSETRLAVEGRGPEGECVFLPLYATKTKKKTVAKRSGLNQWNAGGRARSLDEVYIPVPAWIHRDYPNFFPKREESFELALPDGNIMNAKLCQDGSKALMSNPNSALGPWLLRGILGLKEGELLTYRKLEEAGFDSAAIYKEGSKKYKIEFAKLGSYEEFAETGTGSLEKEES